MQDFEDPFFGGARAALGEDAGAISTGGCVVASNVPIRRVNSSGLAGLLRCTQRSSAILRSVLVEMSPVKMIAGICRQRMRRAWAIVSRSEERRVGKECR